LRAIYGISRGGGKTAFLVMIAAHMNFNHYREVLTPEGGKPRMPTCRFFEKRKLK